jgi:hypothetical protein
MTAATTAAATAAINQASGPRLHGAELREARVEAAPKGRLGRAAGPYF